MAQDNGAKPGSVRIVSDGTPVGTKVHGVDNAYSVKFECDAVGQPSATIKVWQPKIDAELPMNNVNIDYVCPYCLREMDKQDRGRDFVDISTFGTGHRQHARVYDAKALKAQDRPREKHEAAIPTKCRDKVSGRAI